MMKRNISSCHKDTLILHQLHQHHYNILALLYSGSTGYRCTTEYASFATLTVLMSTARDGFPHRRPPPKSKASFQSFPLDRQQMANAISEKNNLHHQDHSADRMQVLRQIDFLRLGMVLPFWCAEEAVFVQSL